MVRGRLVTIGVSHYCEKARWALERAGLPFVEEAHPPVLHIARARLAGGGLSVPVLVLPDRVLGDSTDILRWVDEASGLGLYPPEPVLRAEVEALEDTFDEDLGPHVRRACYWFLLPERRLTRRLLTAGVGRAERWLFAAVQPVITGIMRRDMRIDAQGAARSLARLEQVLAQVEARLADGRRFLAGERFSAADLTFAALLGPLVAPAGYGPGATAPLTIDEAPPALGELMRAVRARPAGAFALRLYAEERRRVGERVAVRTGAPAATSGPSA